MDPFRYEQQWAKSPEEAERDILARWSGPLSQGGYSLTTQSPAAVSFSRKYHPGWTIVLSIFLGQLEQRVCAIAEDLCGHLAARVLEPTIPDGLLGRGRDLADAVCRRLVERLPGTSLGMAARVNTENNYAGGYLNVRAPDGALASFWVVVTPAATSYNVPGWPDVLQLVLYGRPGDRASSQGAGTHCWKTLDGFALADSPVNQRHPDKSIARVAESPSAIEAGVDRSSRMAPSSDPSQRPASAPAQSM